MADKHVCLIVPAAYQGVAQALAAAMGEAGLFTTPLYYVARATNKDVTGPLLNPGDVVAYISVGLIPEEFAIPWLQGPGPILDAAAAGGWTGQHSLVAEMWNQFYCYVSEDSSEAGQAAVGLSTVDPTA